MRGRVREGMRGVSVRGYVRGMSTLYSITVVIRRCMAGWFDGEMVGTDNCIEIC